MDKAIGTRGRIRKGVRGAALALGATAALLACRSDRDFDSPYLPGDPAYAGDDWTRDADGNGVADSLEKYLPECKLAPRKCLENAKILSALPPEGNRLSARNMLLWIGDSAQAPGLTWSPPENALRGYELTTSDSTVARIRDGKVLPVKVGRAQIGVDVPGLRVLSTSFIATVVSGGRRLDSVTVPDIVMESDRDTVPPVSFHPSDAAYKDFSLTSDKPATAAIVGQAVRGIAAGKAHITLETMDGAKKAVFAVTVVEAIPARGLAADAMFLVKDGAPSEPRLVWTPANATDKRYRLMTVEAPKVVDISADLQKVIPRQVGTAQVLAMSADGRLASEFLVTVSAEAVPVAGIAAEDLNLVLNGDPVPPHLSWQPADATDRRYTLVSSDENVALPIAGMVKPVGMGAADLTVTTADGGFRTAFKVVVGLPDTAIHVDSVKASDFSLAVGDSRRPPALWYPANAGNRAYSLKSSDTSIVKPEGEVLRGVREGAADIRLTSADGGRTSDFKVSVYAPVIPVQQVTVDSMSIYVGSNGTLTITWTPSNATDLGYTLVSLDTNIATIVNVGGSLRVHGKSVGLAHVTLKANSGPSTTFTVLVNAVAVKVTGIYAPDFTMSLGDAPKDPALVFSPSNATDKSYTLGAPSGSPVIGVSQNKVTALGVGKAPLTITSKDNPSVAAVCTVTVVSLVQSVSAKDDTLRLGAADAAPKLTWVPASASNLDYVLKSADTNIVKVAASGKAYRGAAAGRTAVIVRALDGSNKADTFTVTVVIPVTQVIAKDYAMKVGDPVYSTTPLFSWVPANATNKNWYLAYTNSAASPAPSGIVTILNGWQLQAVGPGAAQITVTSIDNPAAKDTFTVTVIQPVTGLSATNISMRLGDADVAPPVTISPANASDKSYTLATPNSSVASVVNNKIHAVGGGVATFTARSLYDTTKTASFTVTVAVPVISVSASNLTLRMGDAPADPVLAWNPSNATNKGYTLATSNSAVAGVSGTRVQAVNPGSATITVTSLDGNKTATFTATVIQPVTSISAADMSIRVGDADADPVVTITPANATNKGYVLSGGADGIASVVANKVHAVNGGTASFTVTASDNGKTGTFTVTVVVPVTGIQGQGFTMKITDPDVTPTVTVSPANATNKGWTLMTQDTDIVSIVDGIKIHAVARGTATVAVVSADNSKIYDTFTVTVKNAFGF
jgi:uncharacterized protein YjdB